MRRTSGIGPVARATQGGTVAAQAGCMTTIEITDPDGTIDQIELTCSSCSLDIDPGDADAELLGGLRCGLCMRETAAEELPLAA
jgi:hypothetical protein